MVSDAMIRKLEDQVKALSEKATAFDNRVDAGDKLHFIKGDTKAEREAQKKGILDRLQRKYPKADLNESGLLFVEFTPS